MEQAEYWRLGDGAGPHNHIILLTALVLPAQVWRGDQKVRVEYSGSMEACNQTDCSASRRR